MIEKLTDEEIQQFFGVKEIRELEHFSFSSLSKASTCSNSWIATYIKQLKKEAGEAAQYGLGAEARLAQRMGIKLMDYDEKLKEEPEDLDKYDKDLDIYFSNDRSWKECDDYQIKVWLTPERFDYLCKKFNVPHLRGISLPLLGWIDFAKGKTLMDLKTSKISTWQPKWLYQTIPYLVAEDKYEKIEIHHMVRTKVPRIKIWQRYPTDDDVRESLRWISGQVQLVDLLRTGKLQGTNTPDYWCGWCGDDSCHAREFKNVAEMG